MSVTPAIHHVTGWWSGPSTNSFPGGGGDAGGLFTGNYTTTQPDVAIERTTVSSNAVGAPGIGPTNGQPGNGAGMRMSGGDATIDASTFSANTGARFGGGIFHSGGIRTIVNSTFDSNTAASGGAMYVQGADVTINASTLSDNSAMFGNTITLLSGSTTLVRSVIAGATGAHCSNNIDDIAGGGHSIEQSSGPNTCDVSQVVASLDLGPLQDNGGPTATRLPSTDGPLVNTIESIDCIETVDQRGVARPSASGCDIGAVELDVSVDAVDDDSSGIADSLEVAVLGNDVAADVPLDPGTVNVVSAPANGVTSVNALTGVITYTPNGNFGGSDSFDYEVCAVDVSSSCDTATVSVDIERPDPVPDAFAFVDVVGVATSLEQVSNAITVVGTNEPSSVSVVGGEYSVNGGAFTAVAGTVQPGDTVRVRHTSAADPLTSVDTVLTVGGVSDTFTSTTAAPDVEPAPDGATRFVPLPPVRLFDTRDGLGLDAAGKLLPGQTIDVAVAGNAGVPAGAASVVINLTVAESDGPGFVTAFPRGVARPDASTLNTTAAGQFRPNLATVPLDADGFMSVFALMGTHLIGDVAGYYEATDVAVASGRVVSLAPTRVFDSRPGEAANGPKGFITADSSVSVQVAGEGGVPEAGVSAVVMNVTATASAGPNFVTVWPTGSDRPDASSLNLGLGETTANLVMVPLGDDGKVDFYTLAGAHLLADVTGYVTDDTADADTAGLFVPLTPARVFDTRFGEPAPGPKGFVVANSSITTQTAGAAGVPDDAAAVVLNVTATQAPLGFITVWPTGVAFPTASTLNLQGVSDTRANAAIMPVGDGGQIDYYAISGAHLIADTTGYYLN